MLINMDEQERRISDLMNEAARRFPGGPDMSPYEIERQRLDWIDFQQFGTLPGDFDPRSNEGSYGTRHGLSLEFPRGTRSFGMVRGNIEEREDGPVLVANNRGNNRGNRLQQFFVRGAFAAVGLLLLGVGVVVVATNVSPVTRIQGELRKAIT